MPLKNIFFNDFWGTAIHKVWLSIYFVFVSSGLWVGVVMLVYVNSSSFK
jgi:hypothetical protein